ncbi:MAG: hypothetical protein P1P77_05190 [Spirochaetaceae bacterium]|nr:hypothetical protein [Spirochaetaceae bacterium]
MSSPRFHISAINSALKDFQAEFLTINENLAMKREDVSDDMVNQIVEAYVFLNGLLQKGMDLFTPAGMHSLLEMNHIVLCGSDPDQRMNYYHHIAETRARFMKRIKPIRAWVEKNEKKSNPYKLAAGFYLQNLSQPQLFIEGNHRTGNILVNYLLVSKGLPPYIITPDTAKEYLDISGDIKFTDKDNSIENTIKMPGQKKRFISLLQEHSETRFLEE